MIDVSQKANIKLFELILRSTELLKEFLIGCNDLEIFFIFEEASRDFCISLELIDVLLDRVKIRILGRRVNICFRENSKTFVLGKHHKWNSKTTFVACDLKDVVSVFELLLDHFHSLA
jgi:hypothetical protein